MTPPRRRRRCEACGAFLVRRPFGWRCPKESEHGTSRLDRPAPASSSGAEERETPEVVERALAFVADFRGDPRCGLNTLHSEALAGEVRRLRARLRELEGERERRREQYHRDMEQVEASRDHYRQTAEILAAEVATLTAEVATLTAQVETLRKVLRAGR